MPRYAIAFWAILANVYTMSDLFYIYVHMLLIANPGHDWIYLSHNDP